MTALQHAECPIIMNTLNSGMQSDYHSYIQYNVQYHDIPTAVKALSLVPFPPRSTLPSPGIDPLPRKRTRLPRGTVERYLCLGNIPM